MRLTRLSLAVILLLPLYSLASDANKINKQFKDAYHQYQEAVTNRNIQKQLEFAEVAYELGKQVYGQSDINTARLAFNLATLYNLEDNSRDKASKLLKPLIEIYKKEYGKYGIELIDLYFAYAKSLPYKKMREVERYYKKAIDIAEDAEGNLLFHAQIQLDAGIELLNLGSIKSKVILTAKDYFTEHLEANDKRVVSANFYAGKYYLMRRKYEKSAKFFGANLPVFDALKGPTHPLELNTHAFLITALEKDGRSDEATKHCIAIGSMTPWDSNQEQRPLYRVNPKFPTSMARLQHNGSVQVEFTITDSGFVKNAKILNIDESKGFQKSALAALEQWRYAPKFENGKAVEAISKVQLDYKIAR
ncbi:energy transducer TonB [Pseudoalteromonas denitrificans]|uniref:TonB family C-terminal domain-containing protein n=1 Tax=Pseudoalteromonas denitrificans DSM 6059 TaxID=1123010 RepID=A0A1I1P5Q7_9GAMM|nr:energy transducer TonB [Pseudoalteromonas denitrificans]SFD05006.1 TonB family C-terminal domain-containing protein [Pseudoalteromonas denitrificans DSM 6059]